MNPLIGQNYDKIQKDWDNIKTDKIELEKAKNSKSESDIKKWTDSFNQHYATMKSDLQEAMGSAKPEVYDNFKRALSDMATGETDVAKLYGKAEIAWNHLNEKKPVSEKSNYNKIQDDFGNLKNDKKQLDKAISSQNDAEIKKWSAQFEAHYSQMQRDIKAITAECDAKLKAQPGNRNYYQASVAFGEAMETIDRRRRKYTLDKQFAKASDAMDSVITGQRRLEGKRH